MLDFAIVGTALLCGGFLAFSPALRDSSRWKATVTPLASIMGSGFLVSAPLLAGLVGVLAVACMALLLALAYLIGGAIRFNIRYFEPIENDGFGAAQSVGFVSRIVLAGAYFVSVSYYLQLLAAFALKAVGVESQVAAHSLSSVLLLSIGGVGILWGLDRLEGLEKYAISLNLGMIGALLFGLLAYNASRIADGTWALPAVASEVDLHDARVLLGLLIVVQGFETSRYLGDQHPPEERISTMRLAQLVSSAIYLSFLGLATVLFHDGLGADVTAIIDMTRPVAAVLPTLLALAAVGSQFSAAVADNAGAGGLIEDLSGRRLPIRYAYLLILMVTLALTWETNVNVIISYASRAFALFYALQCVVACLVARRQQGRERRSLRVATYAGLSLVCFLVFALGLPAE